jgi:molybdopterin converting factor small subunit
MRKKMNDKSEDVRITVKFFANFQQYGPKKARISVPKGTVVETLLKKYNIPYEDTKLIIIINGHPHQKLHTKVEDKDVVAIFPPLAGG